MSDKENIEKQGKRIFFENLLFVIVTVIILFILIKLYICPNSWNKISILFQGLGVFFLSLWAICGGTKGMEWINRKGHKDISRIIRERTPIFGLAFSILGLILQL
jgi:hypothetical protein